MAQAVGLWVGVGVSVLTLLGLLLRYVVRPLLDSTRAVVRFFEDVRDALTDIRDLARYVVEHEERFVAIESMLGIHHTPRAYQTTTGERDDDRRHGS